MQQRARTEDQASRNIADVGDPRRFRSVARVLGLAGALGIGFLTGVGCADDSDATEESNIAALRACGLDDGTVEHGARLHACEPGNQKKTTICHIPPGNPANAHTLCIGNAAVPAHLENHGDYLGACQNETPCRPPESTGTGGAPGSDDDSGRGGASVPATGTGGSSGTGGAVIIVG
jgi:hypothetical protein